MSNIVRSRKQASPQTAVAVAGQEEPIEPDYWKYTASSPVSSHLKTPSEPTEWKAPVVCRRQRTLGMRYLYSHGGVRQPISQLGTGPDLGIAVWDSDFQPDQVKLVDRGFNDALYQAGYPGFNLGLSFKVQQLQKNATGGPGYNMHMNSPYVQNKILRAKSAAGTANTVG